MTEEAIIALVWKLISVILDLVDPATAHGMIDQHAVEQAHAMAKELEDAKFGPEGT